MSKEVPVGFQDIRLQFTLDTDASDEQLATLSGLTERYGALSTKLSRLFAAPAMTVTSDRPLGCRRAAAMTPNLLAEAD